MMWQDISRWSKKLVSYGLTGSRFGNVSIRTKDGFIIKRTGVMLDEINSSEDLIEVRMEPSEADRHASTETPSHRAIYEVSDARAIIHAHPKYAIVESLLCESRMEPLDSEGLPFLEYIPIVDGDPGTKKLADGLKKVFGEHGKKAAINRGHGTFAAGPDLEDCFNTTSMIEHSATIRYLYDLAKRR